MNRETKQRIHHALLQVGVNSVSVGVADGVHAQLPETMSSRTREDIGRVLGESFCDFLCDEVLLLTAPQKAAKPAKPAKPAKARTSKRRARALTAGQRATAGAAIQAFLLDNPWSQRKGICQAVNVTAYQYRCLMHELRIKGIVTHRGLRGKTAFAIADAAAEAKS